MPTGVGTALLISSAIGAGTSLAEGAIQSHQTSKAVGAQENSAAQAQANLKPFQDVGTKAFQTLGGLMGLGPMPGQPLQEHLTALGGPLPNDTQQGALTDPNRQPNAAYNQGGDWVGMMSQQQRAANPMSTSSYSTPQQHGSTISGAPMLRVKAPNGTIYQVPADQQAAAVKNGGQVIGPV